MRRARTIRGTRRKQNDDSVTPVESRSGRKVGDYRIIHCQLFQHQKNTDACTFLRAKGVCRQDCANYFKFAKEFRPAVEGVINKHDRSIKEHRKKYGLSNDIDLLAYVLPRGDNICEYCGKSFKTDGRMVAHVTRKHAREAGAKGILGKGEGNSVSNH